MDTSTFLDCLQRSNLLDAATFARVLAALPTELQAPDQTDALAAHLIKSGVITRFQAERILTGRHRGFFICNRYKILDKIGSGGNGRVYLCEHLVMRNKVAVKVLPPNQAEDPVTVERFRREARALATLNHPNIVRALEMDSEGGLPFIVMEYVSGVSLQDYVTQRGPMPVGQAIHCIRQAALGLQHAHENGLVHRDIKPGNLVLDRTGTIRILDLGLARFFHEETNLTARDLSGGGIMGTADYLSPEQAVNTSQVDIRGDIYSLGCTFYFLLRGQPPFDGKSVPQKLVNHQTRMPDSIRNFRPDVPEGLARILEKMLAKAPADRFQTPLEVALALEPWMQIGGTVGPVGPPIGISQIGMLALTPALIASAGLPSSTSMELTPTPSRTQPLTIPERAKITSEDPFDALAEIDNPVSPTNGASSRRSTKQTGSPLIGILLGFVILLGFGAGAYFLFFHETHPVASDTPEQASKGPRSEPKQPKTVSQTAVSPEELRFRAEARSRGGDDQISFVVERMKKLNPGWKGEVTHRLLVGANVVKELGFNSDGLRDLSPLVVFENLTYLRVSGTNPNTGSLADLKPLKGLPLVQLNISNNPSVSDLEPLQSMRDTLKILKANATGITSLESLRGFKLEILELNDTKIKELGSLIGMPIRTLHLANTAVDDLSVLEGMTLQHLNLRATALRDVNSLVKIREIQDLSLESTLVVDLKSINNLKIISLNVNNTPIRFQDLEGFSELRELVMNYKPEMRNVLRKLPKLERLNWKSAQEVLNAP